MAEQLSIILGHFVPVQFIISSGTSSQHASLKKFPQSKNTLKSWLINVHRFYLMRNWMNVFNWLSHLPAFLTGGSVGNTTRTCLLV